MCAKVPKRCERAMTRLHENVRFDIAGARDAMVAIERQDLDEILGNLIENAAKYGGGSVFVTIDDRTGIAGLHHPCGG